MKRLSIKKRMNLKKTLCYPIRTGNTRCDREHGLSKPPASGGETQSLYSRIALDMVTLKNLVVSDHARANGVH